MLFKNIPYNLSVTKKNRISVLGKGKTKMFKINRKSSKPLGNTLNQSERELLVGLILGIRETYAIDMGKLSMELMSTKPERGEPISYEDFISALY